MWNSACSSIARRGRNVLHDGQFDPDQYAVPDRDEQACHQQRRLDNDDRDLHDPADAARYLCEEVREAGGADPGVGRTEKGKACGRSF